MIKIELDPVLGIKLEARFRAFTYDWESKKVILYSKVVPVDDNGNEIVNSLIKPYLVEQIADNNAVVNKSDGTPVDTTNEDYRFDWMTMEKEFDYFQGLTNSPININELILAKMNQGKAQGKFNR